MQSTTPNQGMRPAPTRRRFSLGALLSAALVGGTLLVGGAGPASAQSLDQLRASGQVCERPDGLLHALTGDAGVRQQVNAINQQRLAAYEKVARDTGTTVEQVRVVSGEKLRARYGGCP
jgi:uncharacterized protein YdbL (DUF1318 family)